MTDHAPNKAQYAALARAELARVKANRCPHGVTTRGVCRECQPTETEETNDE